MSDPVVPPVPEALLGPLLEAASEVLRDLAPEEVPASLRTLHGFNARGMARGAARQQLRNAMETDDDFRKQVVGAFLERSEVAAALTGWDAVSAATRIDEAAARSDLPLLASALVAARPTGWMFGLGLAAATFDQARRVQESDAALQAIETRIDPVRGGGPAGRGRQGCRGEPGATAGTRAARGAGHAPASRRAVAARG